MRHAVLLSLLLAASPAGATTFADYGRDLGAAPEQTLKLDGSFRTRGTAYYNLDLDRGATPSGELFFPVSSGDPKAQTLTAADMRLRLDLAIVAPGTVYRRDDDPTLDIEALAREWLRRAG